MKIELVNGDKKLIVDLDGFKVDTIKEISELMTEAGKLFGTYDKHVCHCNNKTAIEAPDQSHPQAPQEHNFSVRERLPNNVVDLSTLNVKQAETSSVLIRCPSCGQSHCVIVKHDSKYYFMRKDYHSQEFIISSYFESDNDKDSVRKYLARACIGNNEKPSEYFKRIQALNIVNREDFNVSSNTELFCPVCKTSAEFKLWNEAWVHPEKYFEFEHICEACGGECSLIVSKDNTDNHKDKYKCEACGALWDD